MAIAPTGAIYKTLTFDGVSSADFGVYITGEAVFNAPQRDVEMVTIPGRNGTFALDNGRFENIEVSYPAGIFADTEADFAEAVSEFRNFLCSRNGYVRLEDDYNASEYRMAVYKSGLEVTPALLKAGEFTLTFDCKPQRWLTSGEEAITVDSGDTITNPTRFEAGPLLEVKGAGSININNETVSVNGGLIGWVKASDGEREYNSYTVSNTFSTQYADADDEVTTASEFRCILNWTVEDLTWYEYSVVGDGGWADYDNWGAYECLFRAGYGRNPAFNYGTPETRSVEVTFTGYRSDLAQDIFFVVHLDVSYDGDNTFTATAQVTIPADCTMDNNRYSTYLSAVQINSTQSILGNPLYFDLDTGEAYKIEGGIPVSVNNGVTIPSELPKLKVGNNTITFDNTINDLKVVPRWWKV